MYTVVGTQAILKQTLSLDSEKKTLRASDSPPNYLGQWFSSISIWKNPLKSSLKHSFLDFNPKVSHSVDVDWGLRFYIFNSLPYNAAAAGWLGGRVWGAEIYVNYTKSPMAQSLHASWSMMVQRKAVRSIWKEFSLGLLFLNIKKMEYIAQRDSSQKPAIQYFPYSLNPGSRAGPFIQVLPSSLNSSGPPIFQPLLSPFSSDSDYPYSRI